MSLADLDGQLRKIYHPPMTLNSQCVCKLLQAYNGTDWKQFVRFDAITYQRAVIYQHPDFDMYIISWKAGQSSPIHDHPERGCLMKVLQGSLRECVYESVDLIPLKTHIIHGNDLNYREGHTQLHTITAIEDTISLHIYSPGGYVPRFVTPPQSHRYLTPRLSRSLSL